MLRLVRPTAYCCVMGKDLGERQRNVLLRAPHYYNG